MFEKHKAKQAQEHYEAALSAWQSQRDEQAQLLEVAENFDGADTNEIMLGNDERVFVQVAPVALVEDRVRGGHYEGSSQGVSIPIGSIGGHAVRYHVGANKGHYVQGTPTPTAIDQGTVFVTNKRVVFEGAKQTRECLFTKLIGFQHDGNSTTFSVSNRQKPTTIFYGDDVAGTVDFRLDLALAHFKDTVSDLVAQVRSDLRRVEGERPGAPAALPS
jgi:hypothetical protein